MHEDRCIKILCMFRGQQEPIWLGYMSNERKQARNLGWDQIIEEVCSLV